MNLYFKGKKHSPITYEISEDGCWICTSHSHRNGRVSVTVNGHRDYLYRHVYREFKSDIPDGLVVRHMCNNSVCCNPDHLEIGTHQDNVNDTVLSGNTLKGEKNPKNVYSESQIREVHRLLCENKLLMKEISEITGVHRATIVQIKNGKKWSWLFDGKPIPYTQENKKYNEIIRNKIKEDIKLGLKQREIVAKYGIGRGFVVALAKELRDGA